MHACGHEKLISHPKLNAEIFVVVILAHLYILSFYLYNELKSGSWIWKQGCSLLLNAWVDLKVWIFISCRLLHQVRWCKYDLFKSLFFHSFFFKFRSIIYFRYILVFAFKAKCFNFDAGVTNFSTSLNMEVTLIVLVCFHQQLTWHVSVLLNGDKNKRLDI